MNQSTDLLHQQVSMVFIIHHEEQLDGVQVVDDSLILDLLTDRVAIETLVLDLLHHCVDPWLQLVVGKCTEILEIGEATKHNIQYSRGLRTAKSTLVFVGVLVL